MSSLCTVSNDGGVHTKLIASIPPKGTQSETRSAKKMKKREERDQREEKRNVLYQSENYSIPPLLVPQYRSTMLPRAG